MKQHDYNSAGAYFITICTKNRREILSRIPERSDIAVPVGDAALGIPLPNDFHLVKPLLIYHGQIADKYIRQISDFYEHISVKHYVIMPDHIHMIVEIGSQRDYDSESEGSGPSRTPVPTENVQAKVTETAVNSVIAKFVSTFKRFCNKEYGENIWQARSYDHIIRDRDDYDTRIGYIYGNPCFGNTTDIHTTSS
ncbi:MAG: hypothetical protein J6I45_03230 [Clostridia bacterium]|nr:hypothetical protein [Clostridia bacterium]